MKTRFKKHLLQLHRLRMAVHEKPSMSVFLNRNERVIPHDQETMRRLSYVLSQTCLNLYPDIGPFYKKLAHWLSVSENELYLTEGVSGAIKSLVETISEAGDNIVFPAPTFAMYPVYARMFNLEYRTVGYLKDYRLDVEAMYNLIDKKTVMVFLPNPNVPIEGTLPLENIAALAQHCKEKDAFLAVDEVYYPFGGPTAAGLIEQFDNLLVMRSFSKSFGLAGIRLGYVLSNSDNIEYISRTRTGYETNSVSMEIAAFFIDNYHIVEAYVADVKEGLSYLKREFAELGLPYNGGDAANFIFVDMGDKALVEQVAVTLKTKDIYVRGGWPEPYASGLCITGGPQVIMEQFIAEFKIVLEKAGNKLWKRT